MIKEDIKKKILKNTAWLMVKDSNIDFFELENNIIAKYEKQDFDYKEPKSEGTGYCIFDLDGNKTNNCIYNNFNECLLVIALNLGLNDFNIINLLTGKGV